MENQKEYLEWNFAQIRFLLKMNSKGSFFFFFPKLNKKLTRSS